MENKSSEIVGEIVAEDYRTAAVFKKYGIDFCCQGNRSLEEACRKKSITPEMLVEELDVVRAKSDKIDQDYNSWPLDRLAEHIQTRHHGYVEKSIVQLVPYLDKICQAHGDRHPELLEVRKQFTESAGELAGHMKKEEFMLFPYIRKMVGSGQAKSPLFKTAKNPVEQMMKEHDGEGERFRKIANLTSNYTPPQDACNTYKVTYALLREFQEDLHLHIHLENNILFPKSLLLEKALGSEYLPYEEY